MCDQLADFMAIPYACIKEWQTLIAGMVALLAAVITVFTIRSQVNLQRRQITFEETRYKDAQLRRERAARAELPDALSALGGYLGSCVLRINQGAEGFPGHPVEAMQAIKQAVEFVDEESAQFLLKMIDDFQVFNARLGRSDRTDMPIELAQYIYDAACLNALINRAFPFARREISSLGTAPLTFEEMTIALNNCYGTQRPWNATPTSTEVEKMIEQRHVKAAGES